MPHQEQKTSESQKLISADREGKGDIPVYTGFEDEEKLKASDKLEDRAEYALKKAIATLKPKSQILADLKEKHKSDTTYTQAYYVDLKIAEAALLDLQKREQVNLDHLDLLLNAKNFIAATLCCFGAAVCWVTGGTAAYPYFIGGGGAEVVAQIQNYWNRRGFQASERDLVSIREEIAKAPQSFLALQTGSRATASPASMFAQSAVGVGSTLSAAPTTVQQFQARH